MKRRILSALLALSMVLTLLPGLALAADEKPSTKPTVTDVLYQVEVMCDENKGHWWSAVSENGWTAWVNDFTVGEIEANTVYQPETYPWRCPVTPKQSLDDYLGHVNDKAGGHRLVTTDPPAAYYYYNSGTSQWEFIKDKAANPNCTVSTDGKNTWYLQIQVTCAEQTGPVWLDSMDIPGYDTFTKEPEELPGTGDGVYLVLARSGVEGDTDVYALYLNPAPCPSGDGVATGKPITAAKLAMEDGELVGYLAGTDQKVTLRDLLITIGASEEGFTLKNGTNYLSLKANMVESTSGAVSVSKRTDAEGAYWVFVKSSNRTLTLFVNGQNAGVAAAAWQTNFWGTYNAQGGDQGASTAFGSSYIYFLHPHVDVSRTVEVFDGTGAPIGAVDGYYTIPTGGYIEVDGETTFTVPQAVRSVYLPKSSASRLTMDRNGGFSESGCEITMPDGSAAGSILRSGSAGGGVYFARTGDNRLYFDGEGAMTDYSSGNTGVPAWLTGIGDRTLRSAYIGEGVTRVGSNAFKFTSLSSVTLSEGLKTIGDSAFESCRIDSIEIPDSVTGIGDNAFRGCLELRSVQVPDKVESIGSNAFANCTRLRDVTFTGSLGFLPNGAFQAMSGYTKLNLVFQAGLPTDAYSDSEGYEGMLPFLHQNGAIVYAQGAPGEALVASGGSDAYFAVLDGGDLTNVELRNGVLPALPAKDGRDFSGWQVGQTDAALPGGSAVTGQPAGTVFTARWGGQYSVACTVTIDGVSYTVVQGETMGDRMPPAPTREGWRFAGWVDDNGDPFTKDTVITGNTVVISTWTEIPHHTVTLDPNGGTLSGPNTISILEGEQLTLFMIPNVVRDGYTFDGWFTDAGVRFLGAAITGDMTLTARWTDEADQPSGGGTGSGSGGGTSSDPGQSDPPGGSTTPPDETGDPDDTDALVSRLPFADVEKESWYAASVAYVYDRGLMRGGSSTSFYPTDSLSRGMMAQIIFNLAENPETAADSVFADVSGQYYTEAVAWGTANGVLTGYSESTFGGDDDMTREQIAVILYRYAVLQGLDTNVNMAMLNGFADASRVSGWARDAMAWAVDNGLLKGRGNNNLDPRANITRAEVAAVLERYCKRFLD